jgi:hypothetical protein
MKHSRITPCTLVKTLGLALISSVSLACASQAQVTLPYNFDFEGLTAGTYSPLSGDINSEGGPAYGWHAFYATDPVIRSLVLSTSGFSSPFGTGSQALALVKVSTPGNQTQPYVTNYFSDTNKSGVDITGSLNGNLTGNGYSFAWDFYTTNLTTNTLFALYDLSGHAAIQLQARFNGLFGYYQNGARTDTANVVFSTNTWYRIEVSNVDVGNGTWDVDIYEWADGASSATKVISLAGLDFNIDTTELASLRISNSSTLEYGYQVYIDNVSISQVPEASALLWAGLALPLLIVRLRLRR